MVLENYAAPIAGILQEPAVLIGHSMGAVLATYIAASGHAQVKGVVALNAIFQRSQKARGRYTCPSTRAGRPECKMTHR